MNEIEIMAACGAFAPDVDATWDSEAASDVLAGSADPFEIAVLMGSVEFEDAE